MSEAITLADYPKPLQDAYNAPEGDIMWRAGVARAAAIMLKENDKRIIALVDLLKDVLRYKYIMPVQLYERICEGLAELPEEYTK